MVIWVKKNEMEAFLPLIPDDMKAQVQSGEWFCIGALYDPSAEEEAEDGEKTAAGVLLFSSEDGIVYGGEIVTMIVLKLAAGHARPAGIISIMELTREEFQKTIRNMKEVERSGYYDQLSENRDDYAGDMNYAVVNGNEVSSMVLFDRQSNGDLRMVMLESISSKNAKELLMLLRYSAGYYYVNYPEDTKVKLTLGIERSRNLATHLFPSKDPIPVRRGFYS